MRDVWVVVKGCHTCVLLKLILLPQLYVLLTPARPACPPACSEDAKRLCLNKTLVGESRDQVGCRN